MKSFYAAAALLATAAVADKRDLCSDGSVDVGGNWYCQAVEAITYTGVGGSGSYNQITNMDSTTGNCASTPFGYSGSMSPLDEEVSMHFRGPINLKKFAVYTPGTSSKARRSTPEKRHAHAHAHAHGHAHHQEREAAPEPAIDVREAKPEPAVGDWVVITVGGVVESWINEYSGESTSAAASTPTSAPAASSPSSAASSASPAATSSSSSSSSSSSGGLLWSRDAYYDSASGSSDGLVFLNHNGGSGSGVFDYTFGNSLSYASSNGQNGASSPQTLQDITLPSTEEIVIMSDNKCGGENGDCGYYRPSSVAHHGFAGASKVFLFEFQMPNITGTQTSIYDPVNMPAVWMLNAQIPRTLQYGTASCSCWTSGCGEFDIFEVLAPGDGRMKSTLHGNIAGGDSDYFVRPVATPMIGALVLYNNNIHIKTWQSGDSSAPSFGSSLDAGVVSDIVSSTATQTDNVSLFVLSS
ncbi:hypothetical protein BAUCODRAFT_72229 [Baudoinia panamericana UAMH 10762]|uniref:glucan endo-1,3-beta-D-glucosidase n=1 Tax=Baudoinia panamericana (strain UAMH 10762) TaxID=717646 RepID=M2N8D8_BAUPA|nr:uncharacterized protein BAUCODRAFT_72229 [Baudoinia panamericana UAMH 10762]EMC95364.1 hypothetical protein BAUCODRAFT_72229 [Baudoinia panamericana UAMH 10762]